MIPQKMLSHTELDIPDLELTKLHDIEVVVEQEEFYKCMPGTVIDDHKLVFGLTAKEALRLDNKKPVSIQVLYTDENGIPFHTDVISEKVSRVIKRGTYGN